MSESQVGRVTKSVCPLREFDRLATLEATALLDTPAEEAFDQFTRLASDVFQTPVALVSLVEQDRQFFKSSVGLSEPWASRRETPLSHSFCQHVVRDAEPLVVTDARTHPLLQDNLAVVDLGVIAYLGIPLTTTQGQTLGSFCVIDNKPREWTSRELQILKNLATLVIEKIELRLFAQQLHVDYLQLRNLELYRDEMAQMLVHDLRNPLASFLAALELSQTVGGLPDPHKEYVGLAQEGGEELLRLVNSILDVSKATAGRLVLKWTESPPRRMIRAACKQMAPLAEQSGVELNCDVAEVLTQYDVQADVEKLHRVLVNLIGNAIQHTPPGGIITVWADEEKTDAEHAIRFSVTDTGHGIPSDAFEQIFQKFGQVKSQRVTGESTGLGLPFSRMVVEAHGGEIWVESKLGQGTSLYFTIPDSLGSTEV